MRQRIGEVVPSSIVCCLIKEWCVKQRPLWHTAALYRDNTKQLRFGGLRSSAYLRFNSALGLKPVTSRFALTICYTHAFAPHTLGQLLHVGVASF